MRPASDDGLSIDEASLEDKRAPDRKDEIIIDAMIELLLIFGSAGEGLDCERLDVKDVFLLQRFVILRDFWRSMKQRESKQR